MNVFQSTDYTSQSEEYVKLLSIICSLSRLFSDNDVPYLYYRAAENVFCRTFDAENLARTDSAYDARLNVLGIGLKTFIAKGTASSEKVAEFNSLSSELIDVKGKALAIKLAQFRNERIEFANRVYGIQQGIYHCVTRNTGGLKIFETSYAPIDVSKIKNVKNTSAGVKFTDENYEYSFNRSKSTLFRKFYIPENATEFDIDIFDDPYEILSKLYKEESAKLFEKPTVLGKDVVILPLYTTRGKTKKVQERSALNQWNARGRPRNIGEVYIPIPKAVHDYCPDFFPPRDKIFKLKVPTQEVFNAKVCQDSSKALMTNPNKALSDWLLRKLLKLDEGELATYKRLELLGFDSVQVRKIDEENFEIDVAGLNNYEEFIRRMKINLA